jgi:MerR HTH family regulatory protein
MRDLRLSTGDLAEISGLPPTTIDRWVIRGLVQPVNNAEGHGRHREYGIVEAVAVTCGAAHRANDFGPEWVEGVVRLVAAQTPETLEQFATGGHVVLVPCLPDLSYSQVVPVREDTDPERRELLEKLSLKAAYDRVKAGAARIARKARRVVNEVGRNRLLVANSLRGK